MVRLVILLFLAQVVLCALALISCLSAEKRDVRGLPRSLWVLVIVLLPLAGPIAWFVAGRDAGPARGARPTGTGSARRPVAPDDDPEFLRSVAERGRRQDEELFNRWEEDLRRREKDLRRREDEQDRPEV
ncbi:PLD nuclease N-terminal domain-containing protein [Micromonospora mirobrigensis]|uniref:Phospholipase_D-nuclease N-terminal n=1 Tax=Micromonospora mirobrigensis TaxID=262898 RepID=A0A1C4U625_9ACTN|nr:PLD nuclease N-terminal domain-containing protein [Micromonospora mirobrigensis]SCE67165.1 Phospholipase_D-nuclease N-terminal [Micromonospora mirobrigensis]